MAGFSRVDLGAMERKSFSRTRGWSGFRDACQCLGQLRLPPKLSKPGRVLSEKAFAQVSAEVPTWDVEIGFPGVVVFPLLLDLFTILGG